MEQFLVYIVYFEWLESSILFDTTFNVFFSVSAPQLYISSHLNI